MNDDSKINSGQHTDEDEGDVVDYVEDAYEDIKDFFIDIFGRKHHKKHRAVRFKLIVRRIHKHG